jgi:hypothetical protein
MSIVENNFSILNSPFSIEKDTSSSAALWLCAVFGGSDRR